MIYNFIMIFPKLETFDVKNSTVDRLPKFLVAKKQKSLKKKISFQGIGLHTGNKVSMILNPAPVNTGYVFRIKKIMLEYHLKLISIMFNQPNFVLYCQIRMEIQYLQ